jgi:hypothetical protein
MTQFWHTIRSKPAHCQRFTGRSIKQEQQGNTAQERQKMAAEGPVWVKIQAGDNNEHVLAQTLLAQPHSHLAQVCKQDEALCPMADSLLTVPLMYAWECT